MRVKARPWWRARPPRARRPPTAARSARANALKDASTMWCALVPASTRTCSVSLAAFATARKNSSARSVSKSPTALGREVALEGRERAAGDVDRGGRARLVHRHHRVAEAADARRGRRAPRRAPGRARCRCPRPCGAGPSPGRPPRCTSRSSSAVARHRVEQVVEEADARSRARPRPCRRAPATAGRRSRPWCGGSARCGSRAALHGLGVHRKALGPRECRAGGREARRRLAGQGYASHPAPERGRRQRRLEARGAAGGQHVVRAGDVVAERGGRRRRPRTGSRRGAPGRRAPRPPRPPARGARARSPRRAHGGAASRRSITCELGVRCARALRREPLDGARPPRRAAPRPGEMHHERAVRAVLGLRQQVERDQLGVRPRAGGHHDQLARARDAVDPHLADHLPLRLLHVRVARARRSRPPARTDSVPYASAAIACAPPIR